MPQLDPYDAILLLSFGGPEGPDEVMPFLERVTAGRGIPRERLLTVAEHYDKRGGVSPINDECRDLLAALRAELDRRGLDTPLLWGNRNSEPFLADTLAQAQAQGVRRIVTVTTSAYQSYSSCRQYRENLAAASESAPELVIDKIGPYAASAGFATANRDLVVAAVEPLWAAGKDPHVLFVTHSIPEAMDETSGPGDGEGRAYSTAHAILGQGILEHLSALRGAPVAGGLCFCSRSGPPTQPWLEPDVNDRLEELAAEGVADVVLVPIGFTADHMEVVNDLDDEAAATAQRVGLNVVRVPTVRTDATFVAGLVDLLVQRAALARGESVEQDVWPARAIAAPSICASGCCPNLRAATPALCGSDPQ